MSPREINEGLRIVAGHDYGSHNHPGVKIAVDAFLADHPHPLTLEANKVWWTVR